MPTIISGDTGIDKIAAGAIEYADLPTGSVLQVQSVINGTPVSATNVGVATFVFQASITPRFASSRVAFFANINGVDNGANGRLMVEIKYDTTSGGTSGSAQGQAQWGNSSTFVTGVGCLSMSSVVTPGSTSTYYFKAVATKQDNSTTWSVNEFNNISSIVLMEIAA